jgi:hypothetical protein
MHASKPLLPMLALFLSCTSVVFAEPSDSDKQLMELTKTLADSPRLLDSRYLSYQLGTPETQWGGNGFEWYETNSHTLLYKLERHPSLKNGAITVKLTIFAPNKARVSFADLESALACPAKKYFDQRVNLAEAFPVSANTKVVASQSPNVFNLNEIEIEYDGAPISPTQEDYKQAAEKRRELAFKNHKNGLHKVAFPMLASHLKEQPEDVEARIKLAESYRAHFSFNQAIEQYHLALAQSAPDSPNHKQCIDGLKSLKVIPLAPGEELPKEAPALSTSDDSLKSKIAGLFSKQPAASPSPAHPATPTIQVTPKSPPKQIPSTASTTFEGNSGISQFNAGF